MQFTAENAESAEDIHVALYLRCVDAGQIVYHVKRALFLHSATSAVEDVYLYATINILRNGKSTFP